MRVIEKKSRRIALLNAVLVLAVGCFLGTGCKLMNESGLFDDEDSGRSSDRGSDRGSGRSSGKDYIELKRVRILDEMGFDRPVEAMSLLVPGGWRTEGSVKWKGLNECRGEIVSWPITMMSPDKAIKLQMLPVRTFDFSQEPLQRQAMIAGAQQGGCQFSAPFTASQYLESLAKGEGASLSNVRKDESLQASIDKMSANNNRIAQQYGTNTTVSGTGVYGTLTWSDGTKGLSEIGVMVIATESRDPTTGQPNGGASTSVFFQTILRYPAEREAEALKIYGAIMASHRMNPVWVQAKEQFLTQLGNAEHAGRMERIRLMGEQSRAYAKEQSDASDARMRDWERKQASSDASQNRFIQTIREVETWKDREGNPVELNAGYKYGWSKPDGTYILTNNSQFDPAVEFKQDWTQMQRPSR